MVFVTMVITDVTGFVNRMVDGCPTVHSAVMAAAAVCYWTGDVSVHGPGDACIGVDRVDVESLSNPSPHVTRECGTLAASVNPSLCLLRLQ